MPRRVSTFLNSPWLGGLNTSIDESLIPVGDLTVADNVLFDDRGIKRPREGIDYDWDDADVTVTARSSTGTSRTLRVPGYDFQVGERITVTGNVDYNATAVSITGVAGDDITYTVAGTFAETLTTTGPHPVITLVDRLIGLTDFWFGDVGRAQQRVSISEKGKFAKYTSGGVRTVITDTGTAYSSNITRASFLTFENHLLIAVDGNNNRLKFWDGTNPVDDILNQAGFADPPAPTILQQHLGRIWCNDKTLPDRLHFGETGRLNVWQGAGDSGALDIGVGDGDPSGITAIFPPFKGDLFVAKRTKLYRIRGVSPETFVVEKVSDGIGCISHNAVIAVEQDDIYFVSDRGVHSLVATANYGSFSSSFKSAKIQRSVNEVWDRGQLQYAQGAYLPEINSIALSVREQSDTKTEDIWLYNVPLDMWYRWPDQDVSCMAVVQDGDRRRLYLGTSTGRVARAFNDEAVDQNEAGTNTSVFFDVRTGIIYPDGRVDTVKMFKRFGLIYKASGSHVITVGFKVDNFSEQTLVYNQSTASERLGVDFILGTSVWGSSQPLSVYTQSVDGVGRGFKVKVQKNDINPEVEIIGFVVDYEVAGDSQETRVSNDA